MPLHLYSLAYLLALPLLLLRLYWRGRREPLARAHLRERFGRDVPAPGGDGPLLWIHAVSVGELRAVEPLLRALAREHEAPRLLLTVTSAAGREQAEEAFGTLATVAWLPFDLPVFLGPLLDRLRPRALLLVETELWPNLVEQCRRRAVPVLVVNARLSERSAAGYARIRPLIGGTFAALTEVLCQDDASAQRYVALGCDRARLRTVGSLKYDAALAGARDADARERTQRLRARLRGDAPATLVAGSTHEGEELMLVEALRPLLAAGRLRLVIAPRQPRRFASLYRQLEGLAGELTVSRESACAEDAVLPGTAAIVLFDRMGMLRELYGIGDLAFVGGSLSHPGGQNPLEPAAQGLPVLTGPGMGNFAAVAEDLERVGALQRCTDAQSLAAAVTVLLEDDAERVRRGAAARSAVAAGGGALATTLDAVRRLF